MSRRKKDPLRALTEHELQMLQQTSRSLTAPAVQVTRAKILLSVADGAAHQDAAHAAGRRSLTAVSHLVTRFNHEGLAALQPRHGGGQPKIYTETLRERILTEYARTPTPEEDGTATWTLSTLQTALRRAPDGLPNVSTYTLWQVLGEAGQTHQKNRTWCDTGTVLRKRKDGIVAVTDPDTDAKKN
jgi:homeodomain-containing protein